VLLGGLGLLPLAAAQPAEAATLYVANNGLDSATCGATKEPCRSLSRAIQNASPKDRILVGPGLYGDLNRDGMFTPATGEEAAEVGLGCRCMIKVDKQLTIESRAGAGATVLDAGGAAASVVAVLADKVTFGQVKKGFTLTGGQDGLNIDLTLLPGPRTGTEKVRVAGNLATANSNIGFLVDGPRHLLNANLAIGNGAFGFRIIGTDFGTGLGTDLVLTGNWAVGNTEDGFAVSGEVDGRITLAANTASSNGFAGFFLDGADFELRANVATANALAGFDVRGHGHSLIGNAAIGNRGPGISGVGDGEATVTIMRNNIYGNDPVDNCGLNNQIGGNPIPIVATNNFWGAASGPGADPADQICNSGAGSVITSAPVASKEVSIRSKPLF